MSTRGNGIEEPLRLDDFQSYLNEHGLSEFRSPFPVGPATAYLGAPILCQDQRVGAVFMAELSSKAGTVMDHDYLLQRVWGPDQPGDARRMRTVVKNLRQKLGDDARNPRYIATVPHVGYRMPKPAN